MKKFRTLLIALALITVPAISARAQVHLILNKTFVDEMRDRVLVDTYFLIGAVKPCPNRPEDDGDLHIAGRPDANVGVSTVAEIQNGADVPNIVQLVDQSVGSAVSISGVWRTWFEHAHHEGSERNYR